MKDLNLMHINIIRLRRKMEELFLTLGEKKICIEPINKMFQRHKHKITIPGYKIIIKDSSTDQGGDLALIVEDDLPNMRPLKLIPSLD